MHDYLLDNIIKSTSNDDALAGKTLLVTGASGQIGLNIVGLALARGAQVVGLYNTKSIDFVHPHLKWVRADLGASDSCAAPPANALIHTAPIWLLPPRLPALVAGGIERVVAFSSTSIFGKRQSANTTEMAVVQSLTAAEEQLWKMATEMKLQMTLLRPTMIYGMGLDGNITRMARTIRNFRFLPVYYPAKGLRQPVQARDLAEAALSVWENPKTYGKAYNLAGGEVLTYRRMAERLFIHLGKKPRLVPLPFMPQLLNFLAVCVPSTNVNGEIAERMNRDLAFDNGPASNDFGYSPRGFLEGDVIV